MNDRSFFERVVAEEPLAPADQAILERRLAESDGVRNVLAAMPEETLSLAWRSALNQRILALAPANRATRRSARWAAGSLAAAALAAVALVAWLSGPATDAPDVTDAIVAAHAETVGALAMGQAVWIEDRPSRANEFDWTEADLGAP